MEPALPRAPNKYHGERMILTYCFSMFIWCPGRESNPHATRTPEPKSGLSTSSSTWARYFSSADRRIADARFRGRRRGERKNRFALRASQPRSVQRLSKLLCRRRGVMASRRGATYSRGDLPARVVKLVDTRDLRYLSTQVGNAWCEWGQIRGNLSGSLQGAGGNPELSASASCAARKCRDLTAPTYGLDG